MLIYCITNKVNGKKYVGQTIRDLKERWKQHKNRSKHVDFLLYRAMRKYGTNNFEIEIIDTAKNQNELNEKEFFWIRQLDTMSPNGYNAIAGSNGIKIFTTQYRQKLSAKLRERWLDSDYRNKMISLNSGNKHWTKFKNFSQESKNKMSVSRKKYKPTIVQKQKISLKMEQVWLDDEYRRKALNGLEKATEKCKKPVINLDTTKIYNSVIEASEDTGIEQRNIAAVCRGTRNKAGGFRWAYLNNDK